MDEVRIIREESVTRVLGDDTQGDDTQGDDNGQSPAIAPRTKEIEVICGLISFPLYTHRLLYLLILELDCGVIFISSMILA